MCKPILCVQPQDQEVVYGQTARLVVELENPQSFTTYQWYRNGKPMQGKTSRELLFHSAVDSDDGQYYCKVTNRGASVVSNVARIKIVDLNRGRFHEAVQLHPWTSTHLQLQSRGAEVRVKGGVLLPQGPPTPFSQSPSSTMEGGYSFSVCKSSRCT